MVYRALRRKCKFLLTFATVIFVIATLFYSRQLFFTYRQLPSKRTDDPTQFNFLMNPRRRNDFCKAIKTCSTRNNENNLIIAITYIHSDPTHFEQRQAIRQTWARNLPAVFILGERPSNTSVMQRVQREADEYDDIVVANFLDSYRNNTLKNLAGLRWVQHHCSDVCHAQQQLLVLKADDDEFIDIVRLHKQLQAQRDDIQNSKRTFFCHVQRVAPAERDELNKWYITPDEYSQEIFPDYCAGPAYLFTIDLIDPLIERAAYEPHIFIDDIFVTGILRNAVGGQLVAWNDMHRTVPTVPDCYPRTWRTELLGLFAQKKNLSPKSSSNDDPDELQLLIDCFANDSKYIFMHLVDKTRIMHRLWNETLRVRHSIIT